MTKNQVKEFLWWVLGVILTIVLLFLTAAMASPAEAAQPGKTKSGLVDYVGRSLDKTIVIRPQGRTEVRPSYPGAGMRTINRAQPPKRDWRSTNSKYEDRRTWNGR